MHHELLSWLYTCLKKADKDKDDKLSQSEMKNFMRLINIEMDDLYTEMLFKVTPAEMLEVELEARLMYRCCGRRVVKLTCSTMKPSTTTTHLSRLSRFRPTMVLVADWFSPL